MTLATLRQVGLKYRRKLIIMTTIGLVVLVIAGYAFWSMNTWSAYKTSYENWRKDLRTGINMAVALPVSSTSERSKKMTAFKSISKKIVEAQGSLCRPQPLIAWQHAIDTLRQSEEDCNRIIAGAEAFGKKMQATTTYLEKEQALAAALANARTTSGDTATEATWESQITTWQDAGKKIAKISSRETSFDKVKVSATDKVKSIESAWQELIAAHKAKDKTKYLEAQAKLATTYEALASLSTESAEQLTALANSLQTAHSQLFGSNT
jgi:hypothetical protein